jgi:GDP-mannose 6-dehydrogenase
MSLRSDSINAGAIRATYPWADASEEAEVSTSQRRRISIFGLGYVGAVSLACLARDGHEVTGVDIDPSKLALLQSGQAPIVEAGIQELTRAVMRGGTVNVTDNVRHAVLTTDVSFVCVGTPSARNGSQDLGAITRIATQLGNALRDKESRHVIVIRSTVQPGTVEEVIQPAIEEASGLKAGKDFSLCFQPEFLREGTSIRDYDNPPFTVVGATDDYGFEMLRSVFGELPGEFIRTSIRTAEMLKYACNAFHALKITFANEIGRIAQPLGVDPHEVMKLLCMDRQLNISSAYLRPGFAFGGSCLPKDLKALMHVAKMSDVEIPMLSSVLTSNSAHIDTAVDRVLATGKRNVGLIGLSFKPGTDDLRESPLVIMAERFIGKGLQLQVFDPQVNVARLIGANRRFIDESIPHIASMMTTELEQLVRGSDVLVVAMKNASVLDALERHTRPDQVLLDIVGLPDPTAQRAAYQGVCW